jgi:hypothetical protein
MAAVNVKDARATQGPQTIFIRIAGGADLAVNMLCHCGTGIGAKLVAVRRQ